MRRYATAIRETAEWANKNPAASAQIEAAFHDSYDAYPDVRYYRKDGSEFWAVIFISPVFDENHTVVQHFASFLDITLRKRDEERHQLLVEELDHRLKNTLATVQSVAMQTLRNTQDTALAREQFDSRPMALSKAHDILTQESWEGALLRQIIDETVAPHRAPGRDRFDIEGPKVWLTPKRALALALGVDPAAVKVLTTPTAATRDIASVQSPPRVRAKSRSTRQVS